MLKKIAFLSLTAAIAAGCGGGTTNPGMSDSGTGYMPTGTGPGAKVYCKSSNKNAWDTFGVNAFVAVNKSIIAKTLADKSGKLGNSFSKIGDKSSPAYNDDAATFEGKLAAFLVYAYGGPTSITYTDGKMYNGVQDMTAAHAKMNITADQYDYFIANQVVPALTDNGVSMDDVSSCFAPIVTDASFKATIVQYAPTGTGPGAKTYCKSSGKNAWDTFGANAFVAVNKSIIAKTLADKSGKLGNSFSKIGDKSSPAYNDDAATFEGKLAAFLVYAYGGPTSITYSDGKTYNGVQDMASAHAMMGITSDQYDYFIANQVVPALTDNGVTTDDVGSCFAPIVTAAAFKASIVGK